MMREEERSSSRRISPSPSSPYGRLSMARPHPRRRRQALERRGLATRGAIRGHVILGLGSLALMLAACGGGDGADSAATGSDSAGSALPVEMHVRWVLDPGFPATMTVHEPPEGQDVYEVR